MQLLRQVERFFKNYVLLGLLKAYVELGPCCQNGKILIDD